MITHQTLILKSEADAFAVASQESEKVAAVLAIREDGFAIVAAAHDMVSAQTLAAASARSGHNAPSCQ
jgi:hypothetical protein